LKAAQCDLKRNEKDEACANFIEASKVFKKISPQGKEFEKCELSKFKTF
jgi:hypothetical protein